jgi:hypothetical protein
MASEDTSNTFPVPDWANDDSDETESAPVAVADEPAAPVEGEAQPAPASDATPRPRDVTGRFAKQSVTPQAPLGAALAPPIAPTPEIAPPVAPPTPAEFSYKADGREYKVSDPEQIRQLLSEGMHHRTTWRQQQNAMQEQVRASEQKNATERATIDFLSKTLTDAFQDPDKLAAMYADWQTQGPIYLEQAKRASLEARIAQYEAQETQSFTKQADEAKSQHLWESIQRTAGEKFPGAFDDSTMAAVYGELAPLGLIQVADRDYPEHGYTKGDILLDENALYGHLARHAQARTQAKSAAELAATKVAAVAAKNAAVMGQGARAPATVSARTGQAPAGKSKPPTDAKEWRRWVDDDNE